jgi:hypothetical protein
MRPVCSAHLKLIIIDINPYYMIDRNVKIHLLLVFTQHLDSLDPSTYIGPYKPTVRLSVRSTLFLPSKRRVVEKNGKVNKCSSWRDNPGIIIDFFNFEH